MTDLFSDNIKIENIAIATKLIQESKAAFMQLFNNSPICMSMTTNTPDKRVYAKVNKKFLERFGFAESEIIGRTSVEVGILEPEESARVGSIIKENGRLDNNYIRCIAKDSKIVHTLSSIEPIEVNETKYLISFFIDITKMMEQQAIIEQHVQRLEEVNKELESFSYSISHDLRAPLRAINGYTKILEDDYKPLFDEEGKRLLSVVQDSAKRMGNLIDDLLTFAMLGKKTIHETVIEMDSLIKDVLIELKSSMNHKAEIKTNILLPVRGDYALIKQVITNLISNGVKYSSKKTSPVVEISSEIRGTQVMYTIRDNGEGFDMRYSDKLFGVFQRLHSNEDFEGTGVGLAIVQRILTKHGGKISAEAEVGKGATFRFLLPT
jgi:PAS domain S-box-containing protein